LKELNKPAYALFTISSAGEGFDKSKIIAKESLDKSGPYLKDCK
jgi:hypothetical protein